MKPRPDILANKISKGYSMQLVRGEYETKVRKARSWHKLYDQLLKELEELEAG